MLDRVLGAGEGYGEELRVGGKVEGEGKEARMRMVAHVAVCRK